MTDDTTESDEEEQSTELSQEAVRRTAWEAAKEADWRRDDVAIRKPTVKAAVEKCDEVEHMDELDFMDAVTEIKELAKEYCVPDYEAFYDALIEASYAFKAITGGARVYLRYNQSPDVGQIAHRHGFMIRNVKPLSDGPFGAEVIIEKKRGVMGTQEGTEQRVRVYDD